MKITDSMVFKKSLGWKACYDKETGRYTAEEGGGMAYDLYEITKEIFDQLDPNARTDYDALQLIRKGRHLFMSVNDRCGPPYCVVFDESYRELCPWASMVVADDAKGMVMDGDPFE